LTRVLLAGKFAWSEVVTIVKPDTLIHWYRKGFYLFWRRKSKPRGRPRIPGDLQKLIRDMAESNVMWGEEQIAAELLLKLGIPISPQTVRRYMPDHTEPRSGPSSQRWMTFVRNHAQAILACDYFVAATARFRMMHVLVVMEVRTRRIVHFNVTAHPAADWTLQQFREAITGEQPCRFVIHDRDSIYSLELDSALKAMGLSVLKTPLRAPQANAFCERSVGPIRRECLYFLIPLNEKLLRKILKLWVVHYNRGRPHSSLGPRLQEPIASWTTPGTLRYDIPKNHQVGAMSVMGGLHHEYPLERIAA
jgi:transposase InsO family protein